MGRYSKKRYIKRANKLLEERYINEKEGVDDEEFLNQLSESFGEKLKDKIKTSWSSFTTLAKREGRETVQAAKILKKVLMRRKPTSEEIKFLKSQSVDLGRILAMATMGVTLSTILNKILSKWDITLIPQEQEPLGELPTHTKDDGLGSKSQHSE